MPEATFDRHAHATTLRGVLEGLESTHRGIFETAVEETQEEPQTDATDLGEIVMKFTSRFRADSGPFNGAGMTALAYSDGTHFYALSTAQSRAIFRHYAQSYIDGGEDLEALTTTWRSVLDRIEGVSLYDVEDRLAGDVRRPDSDDESLPEIDIALWPTSLADLRAKTEGVRRVRVVRDALDAASTQDPRVGVVAYDDAHPDRLLIRARVNARAFDVMATHPYVEKIRGSLEVTVSQSDLRAATEPDDVLLPEGAPIGIIDHLAITTNPWLYNVIVEQRSFPAGFDYGQPTRHGTHVAGFAAWGNVSALLDAGFDGQPHPVYVARVAQANDNYQPQFVGNAAELVGEALDWFAKVGVRIVVLAFAYSFPDNGALIADLSALIDEKSCEHGLVIVVSAGNNTDIGTKHWHSDYPGYLREHAAKVAAPGTAALAVTVGSVAHATALDRGRWPRGLPIAEQGAAAPFSRTGPLRGNNKAGRQKPEFAAHGGSWGWDQASSGLIYDDPNLAAIALIPPRNGRYFGAVWGTSYAAPQVAHELARIQTRYPDAGPNLLRALLALSGQAPPAKCNPDKPVTATYGVPNADNVLESDNQRVLFVYEGIMATNSHTILEVPIPPEFAAGAAQREFSVALAFDPPTRRSRRDYIAGKIQFDFHQKATFDELTRAYADQPTDAQVEADPQLRKHPKPKAVDLRPAPRDMSADTLICRRYKTKRDGWNRDDDDYYLVITHEHSPWTAAQKKHYPEQRFAVAIRIHDFDRPDIDLYALAQARLQERARVRGVSQ
jgi:hypothetical protein